MIDREIQVELDVTPRVETAGIHDPQVETVEEQTPGADRRAACVTASRQSGSSASPHGATSNATARPPARSVAARAGSAGSIAAGGSNPSAAHSGAAAD